MSESAVKTFTLKNKRYKWKLFLITIFNNNNKVNRLTILVNTNM